MNELTGARTEVARILALDHPDCVFCAMWADPSKRPRSWWMYQNERVARFTPLNPVTEGHVLFIPLGHWVDVGHMPGWTAEVMRMVASYAQGLDACNVITSKGAAATQSVFHLHIHLVPRHEGDGLTLPWTGQQI